MNDKNISPTTTAVIVSILVVMVFAGGAYAIMMLFHWQWYQGVALFLFCLAVWLRKPKG